MSSIADALLRDRVQEGRLVESVDEMSEEYKNELRHIVTVSGDTELMSAPAYYYAARKAPSSHVPLLPVIGPPIVTASLST